MTNQIKIAVVGVGRWGIHWLRNILEHPQTQLAAVVEPDQERLATVRKQYNLDENVLLTAHLQQLKEVDKLEAVIVATPATTHYKLISDALRWGYHVLAEKPLTLDPKECEELCQLAQASQRLLMVDHTYLFHPAVESGKNVISSGKLGDLRYGYATRTHLGPVRQDVDALWDLAIHDIAIFNYWLGQSPVQVQATGSVWLQTTSTQIENTPVKDTQTINQNISAFSPLQSSSPKNPNQGLSDLVWLKLIYPDNFQANIHLCWLNPDKQRRLGIVGSRGNLIFDEMSQYSPLSFLGGEFEVRENQFIPINQSREVIPIETAEPLRRVCDRFVHCIRHNTPVTVSSGWVGTELVKILTALTTSLHQGGKSTFLDQNW